MDMKVFVYSKRTSKKLAQLNRVSSVMYSAENDKVIFITESGERVSFDTREVKTTTYQN